MSPKTLYDIARPICFKLNLLGFNFGNEKPEGCWRKTYKLAVKCFLLFQVWKVMLVECKTEAKYSMQSILVWICNLLLVSSCILHFFCVKEREIDGMMKRFKRHPVGRVSEKSLSKHLTPFKIYSALFNVVLLLVVLLFCGFFITNINMFLVYKQACLKFIILIVYIESIIFTLHFPALLCILPCIVACYCRAEMDEAIVEMKRMKSPLRRAKASTKLIEKYQQLYELASLTDRALSNVLSFMKWPFLIGICVSLMAGCDLLYQNPNELNAYVICFVVFASSLLFVGPIVMFYFPLLQYLYLAPSANQIFTRVTRAMIEFQSMDEQWLSRDPISRPYLLQLKMKQVEQLNHMAIEEPPFSLFDDVINFDVFYMIILEVIDVWNTLNVHDSSENMALHRIYRNFMKRCIDCAYWDGN